MSEAAPAVDSTAQVFMPILGFIKAELAINCVIVLLVLVVVGLRIVGRMMGPGLGWDDGFVIFATPLGVAMLCCQGLFAPVGNGYDLRLHKELAFNIPFILKLTFCMQAIYVTVLAAVKASMLSFFIRVFPTPFMQKSSKAALIFVGAWFIAYLGACIFLCIPVQLQWEGQTPDKCGQYMPMIQSLIATNAIGDLVIMALPMHSVWTLKTRRAEKIGITSCFALGLACVVCAVFRLIYISTVDLNSNITGTMSTTIFLFILEPNLAILCVSIPMLRPFYAKYKKRMGGSRLDEYSTERSTGFRDQSRTGATSTHPAEVSLDPNLSTWEMDDYRPNDKLQHGYSVNGFPDESGSEKNLTVGSSEAQNGTISVETKWTVTHSRK
ncbi:integral membrane protein [Fusarium heterosporum]|uniref:Integral membrane protein n=1 Tax=Fusarium heterosporum TaxID=42747 RepID=A0A8H5X3R5_FUSHE|nr:integral membrane protein [Fusarium heterosporum]